MRDVRMVFLESIWQRHDVAGHHSPIF